MKNIQNVLALGSKKKTLKLGALLLSTLVIVGASTFVYTRVVFERTLNVGGSGTMAPVVNPAPETLLVLIVLAFVISLSMFVFLREFSRSNGKRPTRETAPVVSAPVPIERQEAPDNLPSLQLPPILSMWEEAAEKENGKS